MRRLALLLGGLLLGLQRGIVTPRAHASEDASEPEDDDDSAAGDDDDSAARDDDDSAAGDDDDSAAGDDDDSAAGDDDDSAARDDNDSAAGDETIDPYAERFEAIDKRLDRLAEEPLAGKALHGPLAERRSLRVGPIRIIYRFEAERILVFVLDISHRGRAYR